MLGALVPAQRSAIWWSWPVALGASLLLAASLYAPILPPLVRIWATDENFSHGPLIPLVSAYIIWRRRSRLRSVALTTSVWGPALLLVSQGVFFVADLAGQAHGTRLAMLGTLGGVTLTFGGPELFRVLRLPILYLAFMFPYPYALYYLLADPLMTMTAAVSRPLLEIAGVPVYRDGTLLILPNITLAVVEACSGLRSLIALLPLAVLLALLALARRALRVVMVASVVPIAMVANLMRVTHVGITAYNQGAEATGASIHGSANTATLAMGTALLLITAGILRWIERRHSPGSAS
jgi:exosortase